MNAGVPNNSYCISEPLILDGNTNGLPGGNSPADDPVWSQTAGPVVTIVDPI